MADNDIAKIEEKLNEVLVFLARLDEKHQALHDRTAKLEDALIPLKDHASKVSFSFKLFVIVVGVVASLWKIFSK